MFENFTYEFLMNRMLNQIPNTMDKRQGTVVYDMLSPSALELAELYQALDMVLEEGFADSASYYYLLKRAAERNVKPEEATFAVWKGVFTPSELEIPVGTRFHQGEVVLVVISKIKDGEYQLQCETEGVIGNNISGTLLPVGTINGLKTAELTELLIPSVEMEDVEEFRLRYFASLIRKAFGGNVAQYKEYCDSIQGIGAVKVDDAWNGGGTVRLVLLDSLYNIPSEELIKEVQDVIDPERNHAEGLGLAPIGHYVTVVGAEPTTVNITTTIMFQDGYNLEQLREKLESTIDQYLLEIRSQLKDNWEETTQLVVRISQIESRLLMVDGVQDIMGTQLNGVEQNLIITENHVPIRGSLHA